MGKVIVTMPVLSTTSTLTRQVLPKHIHLWHAGRSPFRVDCTGPPSPTSNLRPMLYAPLFPSSTSTSASSSSSPAPTASSPSSSPSSETFTTPYSPYSPSEFQSHTPRTLPPLPPHLVHLREKLESEDLHWKFLRQRTDAFNETFWTHCVKSFDQLDQEQEQEQEHEQNDDVVVVSLAYRDWLNAQKKSYADYNKQHWENQVELLKGGWAAKKRIWKWKWECFKSRVDHGL